MSKDKPDLYIKIEGEGTLGINNPSKSIYLDIPGNVSMVDGIRPVIHLPAKLGAGQSVEINPSVQASVFKGDVEIHKPAAQPQMPARDNNRAAQPNVRPAAPPPQPDAKKKDEVAAKKSPFRPLLPPALGNPSPANIAGTQLEFNIQKLIESTFENKNSRLSDKGKEIFSPLMKTIKDSLTALNEGAPTTEKVKAVEAALKGFVDQANKEPQDSKDRSIINMLKNKFEKGDVRIQLEQIKKGAGIKTSMSDGISPDILAAARSAVHPSVPSNQLALHVGHEAKSPSNQQREGGINSNIVHIG